MFSTPSLWLDMRQTLVIHGNDDTVDARRDPSASLQGSLASERQERRRTAAPVGHQQASSRAMVTPPLEENISSYTYRSD